MAAPLSDRPDDHQTGEARAFDRSSLEQSLAEVLRSAERSASLRAPSEPAEEAATPHLKSDPFRPVDAGRSTTTTVNHVGLRRNGPTPVPGIAAPAPAPDPTPPPPAVIPASLRLLTPPPAEPPAAADATDAPTADDTQTQAPTAMAMATLIPWRPEDDDILPTRKTRRRHRR